MTTADPLSLKSLLFDGAQAPPAEGEGEASLVEVRREMKAKLPNLRWADASKVIDKQIDSILNQPIDGLLVGAWAKYRELRKYCDATAYPPGKTVLAVLVKHRVEASFTPSVVIQVASIDMARVELAIDLRLEVDGMVLEIEGGKIKALQAGTLTGVGKVQFRLHMLRPPLPTRDLFPPVERKTRKVELRAAISFGEGIPIRRTPSDERRPRRVSAIEVTRKL